MLLYIGAFQFVPLVAVMALVLVSSIAVAVIGAVLGHAAPSGASSFAFLPASFAVALAISVELGARLRDRVRRASFLHDLASLGRLPRVTASDVGEKAHTQAHLRRELGLDVPDGWVLTTRACERGPVDDAWLRRIQRALRADGAKVVVRSSFVGEDGERTHAGVFQSVRDVELADLTALRAAVERVRTSSASARAVAYTEGAERAPRASVLIQRQIDGVRAVIDSRPFDGRADVMLVELDGADATVELDLLDGGIRPRSSRRGALVPAPSALFELVIRIEDVLGGPVQVEAVFDGDRWWIVQARRVPTPAVRKAFLAEGPIALDPEPRSPLVWAVRGGTAGIAEGLALSLRRAGLGRAASRCSAEAFVIDGGRIFADAELLRCVLVSRASVWDAFVQARFLFGRTSVPETPRAIDFDGLTRAIATLHRAQATAVLRIALLDALLRVLAGSPNTPAFVAGWVEARMTREREARDSLRDEMQRAESSALALANRAPDLARAFREATGFAQASSAPDARGPDRIRLHVPPLPISAGARCMPIVDRPFEGPVRVLRSPDDVDAALGSESVVWVVPDGNPAYYPVVKHARALILLRGGVLSHLATLAREVDVPSVLWLEAPSLVDGVYVDYHAGEVTVRTSATCSV